MQLWPTLLKSKGAYFDLTYFDLTYFDLTSNSLSQEK
jgi:hypothetical protein